MCECIRYDQRGESPSVTGFKVLFLIIRSCDILDKFAKFGHIYSMLCKAKLGQGS